MGIAEVKFIVSDKKLFSALKALEGIALQPPVVHVPEAMLNGGAPVKKSPRGITGIIRQFVKGKKIVTAAEMRQEAEAHGFGKGSYSYALKQLRLTKEIKLNNKTGEYEVL